MLNIHIIAVGKIKEIFFSDAVADYIKRLSGKAKITVTEVTEERCSENPSAAEIKAVLQKEGQRILSHCPAGAFLIPLCIEGRQHSSEEFSRAIHSAAGTHKAVVFIIGGSFGLSDEVKAAGHLLLSVSKMTFPHQLFRVLLTEQIYRAVMIENGSRYHK